MAQTSNSDLFNHEDVKDKIWELFQRIFGDFSMYFEKYKKYEYPPTHLTVLTFHHIP